MQMLPPEADPPSSIVILNEVKDLLYLPVSRDNMVDPVSLL
jgi:hypothetical protein